MEPYLSTGPTTAPWPPGDRFAPALRPRHKFAALEGYDRAPLETGLSFPSLCPTAVVDALVRSEPIKDEMAPPAPCRSDGERFEAPRFRSAIADTRSAPRPFEMPASQRAPVLFCTFMQGRPGVRSTRRS
jgi:hypothetical protein